MTVQEKQERYHHFKEFHPDRLLLWRTDDNESFEIFEEDAREASRILGLSIIELGGDISFSAVTFPACLLDTYLRRLVGFGYRLALI